jgi:hypothetical protein
MDPIFKEYSIGELQLALDCIYDSHLAQENQDHELVCSVLMDSYLQSQLHWLADCNWDLALACLSWFEE